MACHGPISALLLLLTLPLASFAEEKVPLRDALALQAAMERLIEQAEPSIACVLVSRSDAYAPYGAAPSADMPGKLGTFYSQKYLGGVFEQDEKRRKQIIALDLSHPDHQPEAYGSGIVLDAFGLLLTNAHVVRGATKIYVRLPGHRGSYADIYASDPRSDLAVLKLIDPPPNLKPRSSATAARCRQGAIRGIARQSLRGRLSRRQPECFLGHRQQLAPPRLRADQ